MKLMGSLLLVLAGLTWGLGRTWELKRRVELLCGLEALLLWLGSEISFSARPLPELIRLGDSPFCRAAVTMPEFREDPCGALDKAAGRLLKDQGDRELFGDFVNGLGTSGREGQLAHLELCGARTRQRISEARAAYKERSRLYPGLGALMGLGAWVLLI